MDVYPEVLMFIGRFSHGTEEVRAGVYDCFLCGCCWWFAYILSIRFAKYKPDIMIDYIQNHFGCKIDGIVYDITGDVTNDHNWKPWNECEDDQLKERIVQQCIMF